MVNIRRFQRQHASSETLSHNAFLRLSGPIERRARPHDGYESFSISDAPIEIPDMASGSRAREASPAALAGREQTSSCWRAFRPGV
jgi:hypothetical protein